MAQIFSDAQSFDEDYKNYRLQFETEQPFLKNWVIDNAKTINALDPDGDDAKIIIRTLATIARIFAGVEKMQDLYGLVEADPTSNPGPAAVLTPEDAATILNRCRRYRLGPQLPRILPPRVHLYSLAHHQKDRRP